MKILFSIILNRGWVCLLFFCFFSDFSTLAQNSAAVDSFHYYVRSINSTEEMAPLSEDDPEYKEPEAELTLVVFIKGAAEVRSLTIDLGNQKDQNDIRGWNYTLIEEGGGFFFKRNEKLYAINNGKVIITERVPISIYTKKMHLRIQTTNKDNGVGKKYKEFH